MTCIVDGVGRQAMQRANRSRDSQRDLRAGTEADMPRDRSLHMDLVLRLDTEMIAECRDMLFDARLFVALNPRLGRTGNRQDCRYILHRQADAAEAVGARTRYIEKAEMKARRDFDGDGFRHLLFFTQSQKSGPAL